MNAEYMVQMWKDSAECDGLVGMDIVNLKGIYTPAGSLTFSNSGLPDHHSPTL